MTWGLVAVAGATLVSGSMQSNAASGAVNAQAGASDAAIGENRRQYDLTRGDYAPYREAGTKALAQYQTEINGMPTAAEVMSDPGYQFGLQQGQQGLDRKAAAAGGRVSGASLKSAAEYATNYGATGYNAAYQRRQDRLNRLAALANVGQSATGSSAAAGQASTNAISGIMGSQGDASAAGTLAQGNIWGNTINQLGALGQRWAQPSSGYSVDYGGGSINPSGTINLPRGSFN